MIMLGHLRDSVKQVDGNSWLIDDRLFLRRSQAHETSEEYLWRDGEGWHYSIVDAPTPLPNASPLSSDSFPSYSTMSATPQSLTI